MSKERNYFPTHATPQAYIDVDKFIEFDSEELPEILGWMVGGKYKLELLVEEVSESKDGEQEAIRGRFKIIDVSAKRSDMPHHLEKLVHGTS